MQLSLTTKVNSALQTSLECATLAKNGCTVHSTINCQKEIDVVSKAWKVPAMARRYSPARPWGREPGADQLDQLLDRESVREHQRLGAAAPRAAVIRGRPPMTSGCLSEQGEDDGGPKNDAKPHKPENCNSLPPAGSFHAVTKQQAGLVHSSRIPGVTIPHYLNNYSTKASAQELEWSSSAAHPAPARTTGTPAGTKRTMPS
jgi:hypothetical protein